MAKHKSKIRLVRQQEKMKALLTLLIATTLLLCLISCTTKRTLHRIGIKNVYLEKQGKFCNLFYRNKVDKYLLIADSVVYVNAYDSVFAYSRVVRRTHPDMIIVKVSNDEQFYRTQVGGFEFAKVFPTFFNFGATVDISFAPELYDLMSYHEVIISDEDIVSLK